jgi:hypothetical protein
MSIEVDPVFGCHLWRGAINGKGYGPHRASWERYFGRELPPGVQLDHTCNRRRCISPLHLDPVTPGENQRRRLARARRHLERCPSGHRLTAETTLATPEGGIVCTLCPKGGPSS